jgi:Zn-dependent oligopeptidase
MQNEFLPRWDEVKAEHVKPGIQHIIADLEKELTTLEANVKPTWEGLVEPLERISDRISRAWGTVSHLKVSSPAAALCFTTDITVVSIVMRTHWESVALKASAAERCGRTRFGTDLPDPFLPK